MFRLDISESRLSKFKQVASHRQTDLTVVLENVHDLHNIGAVLRSCDSVGIDEIYLIDSDPRLTDRKISESKSSSTGIIKWIRINEYDSVEKCMMDVRSKYKTVIGTLLGDESKSLFDLDYTSSTALVFGNEKDGITEELAAHLDHNMIIPQFGFAQSLNISVACAVTLYEVLRQRMNQDMYGSGKNDEIVHRFRTIDEDKRLNKINFKKL